MQKKRHKEMALQQQQQKQPSVKFASAFILRLEELLSTLHETFPECPKVKSAHNDFHQMVKPVEPLHDHIVRKWHMDMHPHYETIRKRDIATLLEAKVSLLEKLDMKTKWQDPTFDNESREVLFVYLEQLNSYADIHCSVPGNMMSKIESTAMKVVSDLQNNSFDPNTFNVQQLTESLLSDMSEDELQQFAQGIPRLQSTFQSLVGNDMSSLAGLASTPGINIGSLLSQFGNLFPQQQPPPPPQQ
jgi:hypothetical protein